MKCKQEILHQRSGDKFVKTDLVEIRQLPSMWSAWAHNGDMLNVVGVGP